ncbi:hypothetical protein I5M19_02650 [Mucilaginibacter sp. SD-g]|uniref:Exosortase/archaeosortase family protein n=1 Tax=Mucilaginibacter segetis TaxID=2793071 RepID=A0A934ULT4_9SPHI|nr:hypothetical protein [Mucilaginibacter segetis]MBK0378186.1 hypothetical protein [Mucilaginibacter segetis]
MKLLSNVKSYLNQNIAIKFAITFIGLFLIFYYFNVYFFGLTSVGNHYNSFLDQHLNYISWLRWLLLNTSAGILNFIGFAAIVNKYELLVSGHGAIRLIYTCLGLGVMSFFVAFVIAYPKKLKSKLIFLITGLLTIQLLNIIRLMLIALYWNRDRERVIDHHTIFNLFIYIIIAVALYFWVNSKSNSPHASN